MLMGGVHINLNRVWLVVFRTPWGETGIGRSFMRFDFALPEEQQRCHQEAQAEVVDWI